MGGGWGVVEWRRGVIWKGGGEEGEGLGGEARERVNVGE